MGLILGSKWSQVGVGIKNFYSFIPLYQDKPIAGHCSELQTIQGSGLFKYRSVDRTPPSTYTRIQGNYLYVSPHNVGLSLLEVKWRHRITHLPVSAFTQALCVYEQLFSARHYLRC